MLSITKLGLSPEMAQPYIKRHLCGECGGVLELAWGGNWGIDDYVIRCGQEITHEGLVPIRSEKEEFESGADLPPAVIEFHKEREHQRIEKLEQRSMATLSREQSQAIIRTIWPEAPGVEIAKAAILCRQYGLNPLRGHVFLLKFKNKDGGFDWVTVLGIRAKRLITRRVQAYSYVDGPRIMTEDEQVHWNGEKDGSRWWAITKVRGKDGMEAPGIGNYAKDSVVHGREKGNTPQNMAMIRSESAALQRLCPDEMPGEVETIDEAYVDMPTVSIVPQPALGNGTGGEQVSAGEHWCAEHQTAWFQKGKMKSYAHPIKDADGKDTGNWCHEHKKPPQPASSFPRGDVSPPPSDIQATTPAARFSSDGGQPGETPSQAHQQPQPVASTAQGGTKPQPTVAASARAPQEKPPTDETPSEPVGFRTWGEVAAACANLGVNANQVFALAGVKSGKRFLSWLEMEQAGWTFKWAWALAQEIKRGDNNV